MTEGLKSLVESIKAEVGQGTSSTPPSAESGRPAPEGAGSATGSPSPAAQPPSPQGREGKPDDGSTRETGSRPNLNSVSREDKAAYAFRRQLERQRTESDEKLRKRDERIAELERQVAELTKPAAKKRADFGTDDEYMGYLAGKGAEEALAKRDAETAEKERKAEAERKRLAEENEKVDRTIDVFRNNAVKAFGEERAVEFLRRAKKFGENGLTDILDRDPVAFRFFFENEDGPAVLDRVMSDRQTAIRALASSGDPMERLYTLHEIAKEIHREELHAEGLGRAPALPVIGKPGSGSGRAPSGDIFASSKSLSDYIKGRKTRSR